MIVYRPHRHLLAESMNEMEIFTTEEEMIAYVKSSLNHYYNNIRVIVREKEVKDVRIGWNHTRLVCITSDETKYPMCVGMCDLVSFVDCSEEEIKLMHREVQDA